ncbi:hypothetical protein [Limobrevibacterium gyesilva]|uniref:Uncharacterized protein n=1 Tax=Limobrevibacterium gyesilva TaxID=2991712 RepID=A0AA41YQM3_9PROT|nr:hypothetical protein [Limobrevibacterium gyesilva]MCW3474700.1 hypothetical protein [Limobrevibacterium gyesilva]
MVLSPADLIHLANLKAALQEEKQAAKFEQLVAALIGRLLGVGVAVAKASFQHGGDAGTAGRQGRRLRIECKKYADTTDLSDRELLGEVDQALDRDPALEAWILAATREAPEQLEQMLAQKALRIGVPIVIVDWKGSGVTALAALCAFAPDLVEVLFSAKAAGHAHALQAVAADAVERLRRDFQAWTLGFESLRTLTHGQLQNIWTSPRASAAALNQNAAGASAKLIARPSVSSALNAWWSGSATGDAPATVLGPHGVGKTWATLAWLVDSADAQPIVLVIASSAAKELVSTSELSVKRFLAARLYELSGGVRDVEHWLQRLEHLLKRPAEEGPVMTVFFDGMNQEPSVPWIGLLKTLQAAPFAGRIRVIVSTRNLHFEDKLGRLRGLIVQPAETPVRVYDDAPGGELDQRLALEGLTRGQLHSDLLELARTPRLFNLVVRLKDRLVETGEVTLHRLLWEYGRDAWGERSGSSFSEADWRAWLSEIATRYRDGARNFSMRTLAETASRPDLSEGEVFARLSDIIDGQLTTPGPGGVHRFRPNVVAHALGAALLAQLGERGNVHFDELDAELAQWLDPIAGYDERAEILRASVSILVELGEPAATPLAGVLVTAWLQTQNLTDAHRQELAGLAVRLPGALLDAIEHSADYSQASTRLWAVNALRTIRRQPGEVFDQLVARSRAWLSEVSRDVQPAHRTSEDIERHRAARFMDRVGIDNSGPIRVLGVDLMLVDRTDGAVAQTVPSILEGFPLAGALPVFEAAAVALAAGGRSPAWDGLKWLCLLNEVDPVKTTEALRSLSASVAARTTEPGINGALPARAAALLLWLTGVEDDDVAASALDPGLDRILTYETDYLPNPGRSVFTLERRHAERVLCDTSLPLLWRVKRTCELWLDPHFEPPAAFVGEVRTLAASFDVTKLDHGGGVTIEDHNFEIFELALARCAAEQLGKMTRAKLTQADVPAESRYRRAIRAAEHLILAGPAEAAAARTLRLSSRELQSDNELFASTQLLLLELQSEGAARQVEALMEAQLQHILLDVARIQHPLTREEAEALLARWRTGSLAQRSNLICLLQGAPIETSELLWNWLKAIADGPEGELHGVAFRALASADGARFGRSLLAQSWSWSPGGDYWVNHYGSGALIKATAATPFDQVAPSVAPWRLLEAARARGEDPTEVRLAADILSSVLAADGLVAPDPGALLTIDRTLEVAGPCVFSVTPIDAQQDPDDPAGNLRRAMDAEAQLEARRRSYDTAVERIRRARASGASLYLANLDTGDMVPVLRCASDIVDLWLQGAATQTADFRRRVILAESAFLALCEALLRHDPDRGVLLWRGLKRTLSTRFIGEAKIDDMIHMVFRAPTTPALAALREELLSLEHSCTDKDLFDLAIAASLNGEGEWLAAVIAADLASPFAWRRKRALFLEGLTAENTLPQPLAWPDGPLSTSYDDLRHRSARFRYLEACAHYWWGRYLAAPDAETAYATWILFVRAADRRAWVWVQRDADAVSNKDAFHGLKMRHAIINYDGLIRSMQKHEDTLERSFLHRAVQNGVGPWGKAIS